MRMMLRMRPEIGAGNRAAADGSLGKLLQEAMEAMRPEAAYFVAEGGGRCAYFFFDLDDQSRIPAIAEPFFHHLNAQVEFLPAMNQEDLGKGLAAWAESGG